MCDCDECAGLCRVCQQEVHDVVNNRHWPCGREVAVVVLSWVDDDAYDMQRLCFEHGKAAALALAQSGFDVQVVAA